MGSTDYKLKTSHFFEELSKERVSYYLYPVKNSSTLFGICWHHPNIEVMAATVKTTAVGLTVNIYVYSFL
jgi:hypothetical protein